MIQNQRTQLQGEHRTAPQNQVAKAKVVRKTRAQLRAEEAFKLVKRTFVESTKESLQEIISVKRPRQEVPSMSIQGAAANAQVRSQADAKRVAKAKAKSAWE